MFLSHVKDYFSTNEKIFFTANELFHIDWQMIVPILHYYRNNSRLSAYRKPGKEKRLILRKVDSADIQASSLRGCHFRSYLAAPHVNVYTGTVVRMLFEGLRC